MKRRSFLQMIGAGVFLPSFTRAELPAEKANMMVEDNRIYAGIPNSGPQHYVGQVLKDANQTKAYLCIKIEDSCSWWIPCDSRTA